MKPAPTRERVKRVMEEVDALGLSDEAYWAAVQKMLGLDESEVFEIIEGHDLLWARADLTEDNRNIPTPRGGDAWSPVTVMPPR